MRLSRYCAAVIYAFYRRYRFLRQSLFPVSSIGKNIGEADYQRFRLSTHFTRRDTATQDIFRL